MDRRCPDCHRLVVEKSPRCECGHRFARKLLRHQVTEFLGPNDLGAASGAVSRSRFLWRATILCFVVLSGVAVLAFSRTLDRVLNGDYLRVYVSIGLLLTGVVLLVLVFDGIRDAAARKLMADPSLGKWVCWGLGSFFLLGGIFGSAQGVMVAFLGGFLLVIGVLFHVANLGDGQK
ncbi:MAG: hypothetical protein AB7S38_18680 [Vulcanimicrobiota bacterium]